MVSTFTHKISLGQNFLKNPEVLRRCVEAGELAPQDVVLEIGCGQGALTRELLKSEVSYLHAIEIDRRLAPWLLPLEEEHPYRFHLCWCDVLSAKLDELSPLPDKILANIPYNITTDLIWKAVIELAPSGLRKMILLIQREAAERLVAPPGSKRRYPLGVTLELLGSVRNVMHVAPGSFVPPPKVWSSLIAIDLTGKASIVASLEWKKFLCSGFAQRRKKLINVLAAAGYSKTTIAKLFAEIDIAPTARAEELTAHQWFELYTRLRRDDSSSKTNSTQGPPAPLPSEGR